MQSLPKSIFIFLICLPLAVILGVMLATPLDRNTVMIIGAVFLLLLSPILLTRHHLLLIASWNAFVIVFFLPGQPYLWMLMTAVSFSFMILTRTLNRGKIPFLNVPSITLPLLMLAAVSYITCKLTGGFGTQALGSEIYGGKRYFFLWAAIGGYFALSNIPAPPEKRQLLAALFFLSSVTAAFSNLAFILGQRFYFLFVLFPVDWAMTQAVSESQLGAVTRVGGLGPAGLAVTSFILCRYGIRGILNLRYPWRLVLFVAAMVANLFSGFRALLLFSIIICVVQFMVEGLHKTKYLPICLLALGLVGAATLPFANRLPLSLQRCLTVLPLELDSGAMEEARGSTQWRLEVWRQLIPDVPQYLLLGKGFAIDPKDLFFAQMGISMRADAPYQGAIIAGDYHSGPLTLIIPFGIWGAIAFTWFCIASVRLLLRNYRYGEESIRNINAFLLTAFVAKLIYYLFIFGAFYMDLAVFTGIVAMSVSFNRGVVSRKFAPPPAPVAEPEPEPELIPVRGALEPALATNFQRF